MQDLCSAQPLQVLLIEDNSADARLVRALLAEAEDRGSAFGVAWVTGLDAALDALGRCRFDAVLLDLGLPDARGGDLIATLHAAAPEAAIIVASGQAADDCLLARAIIRKGAEEFLPKDGLTASLLARTITTAVERRRTTTALRARTAQLETALIDARIGQLSWVPRSPEAALAGDLPRFLGVAVTGARLSMRRLLRQVSAPVRQSLYAAWRELAAGADRLAVVLVEHDRSGAGCGHDLLIETVVQRDAGGRIVQLDALIRDTAMVGQIERLEGEMITHLGHELRTPLTTIRATLGLLAHGQDALTASARQLVENAIANAERINRVIGDTLGSSADQPASLRFQPRRVALGPHLYDALTARLPDNAEQADRPNLTLTTTSRSLEVMVDAARLRRAVDCLFAQLHGRAGRADRLALDVSLQGAVAWLKLALPATTAHDIEWANAGNLETARPMSAVIPDGTTGLCIAVPLAA